MSLHGTAEQSFDSCTKALRERVEGLPLGSGRKVEPIDPLFFRRLPGVHPMRQACARAGQIPTVGTVAFSASMIPVGAP